MAMSKHVAAVLSLDQRPPCPLCFAASRPRFRLAHGQTFKCASDGCGLEFVWPQMSDAELSAAYTDLYYPQSGHSPHLENTPDEDAVIFVEHIARHCRTLKGTHVLDYGCGRGTLLKACHGQGASVAGIEMDDVARQRAQQLGAPVFSNLAELREAQVPLFDCVILSTVVEHLRQPWEELADIRTVMKMDGVIVVTAPNTDCLKSRLRRARWDQRTNPTHLFHFNDRSLTAVLVRAGFHSVCPLPPILTYSTHGFWRRSLQRALGAFGLQGGLLHAASPIPIPPK